MLKSEFLTIIAQYQLLDFCTAITIEEEKKSASEYPLPTEKLILQYTALEKNMSSLFKKKNLPL